MKALAPRYHLCVLTDVDDMKIKIKNVNTENLLYLEISSFYIASAVISGEINAIVYFLNITRIRSNTGKCNLIIKKSI